jgi:prepilin peptidase CpaA
MLIETIRLTLFPVVLAFAAFSDLFTMTIANRVSIILVAGFFLLAILTGMGVHDMLSHAGAGAAVLVVAFACFTQGWIGGGDAKLAAVTVLWLGLGHLADYLVYASLLGGALTIGLIQFRAIPMPQMLMGQAWAERLHRSDTGVPYGIALAIAALIVYPQTEWMTALNS